MTVIRKISLLLLACISITSLPRVTRAAHTQLPNGVWRVYISNRPVVPVAQQTPVWCWAASLSALFGYFGHPVNQQRIVSRYFGGPVPTTGPPMVMISALNSDWQDDLGRRFKISSPVTNMYPPQAPTGPFDVNNIGMINALDNEIPVFYADTTHAMILVQIDYIPVSPNSVQIVAGYAIDPFPRLGPCPPYGWNSPCPGPNPTAIGFRQLQQNELTALFAGIPRVTNLP